MFAHKDPAERTKANLDFKARCLEKRVLPYCVPVGGFMLTPRYDDEPEAFGAAVRDMAECALETVREMGWADDVLLPAQAAASTDPIEASERQKQLAQLREDKKRLHEEMEEVESKIAKLAIS